MKTTTLNDIYPGIDDFWAVQKEYLKKFGKKSLIHTIYDDPLRPECIDFKEAVKNLRCAIQKNKPIEPIPDEIWKEIVF